MKKKIEILLILRHWGITFIFWPVGMLFEDSEDSKIPKINFYFLKKVVLFNILIEYI